MTTRNRVTKSFEFCAAHRLYKYNGPCRNIHGHNYKVAVSISSDSLKDDMVIDFKTIKEALGTWIDEKMDHAILINTSDTNMVNFAQTEEMKMFIFPCNPTAENIAARIHLAAQANIERFAPHVKIDRVAVWETPTSFAEAL